MSSLKNNRHTKHSLFGSVLAAIGLGAAAMRGSDANKYIKSPSGAWARTGSTKYIDHKKVLQARKECAAHNKLLGSLKEYGIVSRKGNVKPGRMDDYIHMTAQAAKQVSI